jgi:hypothetical protein
MKKILAIIALLTWATPALAGGSGGIIGAIIGGALAFATGGLSLFWTAAAVAGGAAVGYMVGATIEMIINPPSFDMPDASNAQAENQNAGVLVNKQGTNQAIPVVYGQRKIGATRVFVATNGETNRFLYMACVLCEGEIKEITKVYIDDTLVWTGATAHGQTLTATENNNFKGRFTFQAFHGTTNQSYSTLLQEAPGWGADKPLKGLCYLAVKCEWPKIETKEDSENNPWSGLPSITVEMRGKKVYYPSNLSIAYTGLTYAQRRSFANYFTTFDYSNNPVDCLLDYLRNDIYGKDFADTQIDWHSFYANRVRWAIGQDGNTLSDNLQHKTNAVVFTDRSLMDNIKTFLLNMRSSLIYQDGRYRLVVVDNGNTSSVYATGSTSVMTINENDIIDGIRIDAESAENKYNRVVITYMGNRDGSGNMTFEPIEYTYPEADSALESQYLVEDGGRLVETRITMEHITDGTTAAKLAQIVCDRARTKGKTVTFQGGARLFQLEVGDVVTLNYSSLSISGKFRVKNIVQNADFTFQITLEEHEDVTYAYNPHPITVKGYTSTVIGAPIIPPNVPVLPTPPSVTPAGVPVITEQTSMGGNVIRIKHTNQGDSTITGVDAFIRQTGSTQDYQFHQGFSNFAGLAGQISQHDLRLPVNYTSLTVNYDVIYKYSRNYGQSYGPATVPYVLGSRPAASGSTTNGVTF